MFRFCYKAAAEVLMFFTVLFTAGCFSSSDPASYNGVAASEAFVYFPEGTKVMQAPDMISASVEIGVTVSVKGQPQMEKIPEANGDFLLIRGISSSSMTVTAQRRYRFLVSVPDARRMLIELGTPEVISGDSVLKVSILYDTWDSKVRQIPEYYCKAAFNSLWNGNDTQISLYSDQLCKNPLVAIPVSGPEVRQTSLEVVTGLRAVRHFGSF